MRRVLLLLFAAAAILSATCKSPGKERWDIKSSLPSGASLTKSKSVSLVDLVKLPNAPSVKNKDSRYEKARIPAFDNPLGIKEGDLVTIQGYLFLIATEDNDCEYHIQLASKYPDLSQPKPLDDCIIVEVGLPKDMADDKLSAAAQDVRQWLLDKLKLTSHGKPAEPSGGGSFIQSPVFVAVTGQLFYDDAHLMSNGESQPRGKRGFQTKTLWELHPIVKVAWGKK